MLAILLAPIYIALNVFVFIKLLKWLKVLSSVFKNKFAQVIVGIIYWLSTIMTVIAFLLDSNKIQRIAKLIANYDLGVEAYICVSFIVVYIIRAILILIKGKEKVCTEKNFKIVGALVLVFIIIMSVYGAVHARHLYETDYEINVDKSCGDKESLNVVLLADLHLGYNIGQKEMKNMVEMVNKKNPDIILIAGDVFDNEYESLDNPKELASILKELKAPYGVYATYGNHDIQEKLLSGFTFGSKNKKESDPRMDKFLKDCNITLLRDETLLIDDSFYLVSRPDYEKPGRGIDIRKTPKEIATTIDKSKPVILFEHEPVEQEKLDKIGVDLDLNGHTHDGQIWPGTWTIHLFWDHPYGYKQYGNLHNIVTSGVGLFGPYMRVGSISEVVDIKVNFNK